MTVVRFADGTSWDVVNADCEFRPCLSRGFDKGVFAQGRGYTRYHDQPRPCCMQRHVHGCPHKPASEGTVREDGTVLLALLDPLPCCDSPDVPKVREGKPLPYVQTCRSCKARLRGKRLEVARGAELSIR